MRNDDAILMKWYVGEVGGEAIFSQLAARASAGELPPGAERKWRALAQVEATVASRLAAVLASRGVAVPVVECTAERAQARCEAAALAEKSWPQTMQWLHAIAAGALREMQADAHALPLPLTSTGMLVIRHETALLRFAELELADDPQSLQPIEAFLGETALEAGGGPASDGPA